MESLVEIVVSNGVFACLFVWLLFYILKDSKTRENKYIEIINKFSKQLDTLEDVQEDIKELKQNLLYKKKGSVKDETKTEIL